MSKGTNGKGSCAESEERQEINGCRRVDFRETREIGGKNEGVTTEESRWVHSKGGAKNTASRGEKQKKG